MVGYHAIAAANCCNKVELVTRVIAYTLKLGQVALA
jgi:hypothetical protein